MLLTVLEAEKSEKNAVANSVSGEDYLVLSSQHVLSQGGGDRRDRFPEVSFIR